MDQVVDSAALAGELGGAAAGGRVLFTLRYDTLGMADTVRIAEAGLPGGARDAWLRAVSGRIRQRSPFPVPLRRGRPQGWSVLLRVDAGSSPAFRVGRSEECPPVLTNGRAGDRRAVTVPVRIRLDSLGRVVRAEPASSWATQAVANLAVRVVGQGEFRPALLDRQPAGTWVEMPIIFTVGTPRTQTTRTIGRSRP